MSIQPVPYLIVSQELDIPCLPTGTQSPRVYVCINLLDHRAVGIATTRDRALEAMTEAYGDLNDAASSLFFESRSDFSNN